MVLAEALLRVPDAATADRLIEDKLAGRRLGRTTRRKSSALLVVGLGLDARHHRPHHPARARRRRPSSRAWSSGSACRRCAPRRARRCGCSARISCSGRPSRRRWRAPARTASSAIPSTCWARARAPRPTPSAISPPMRDAIDAIGARAGDGALPDRPGISVKLSALHPRFEAVSRERVMTELVPRRARARARRRKAHDLNFTVDAEEADRLELSLDVIGSGARRSLARRLGRLRPRGAGLSEARRRR